MLRRVLPLSLAASLGLLVVVCAFGFAWWLGQVYYVSTDNALITGGIAHVASPATGQVRRVLVEVGDPVRKGDLVAVVGASVGTNLPQPQLRAPVDGVVVAVNVGPGDVAVAGRPLVIVVDPSSFYVLAQIDEANIGRVHPGQEVDVEIDSLGSPPGGAWWSRKILKGRVTDVASASASALLEAPPTNPSGYFVKVSKLIPVRIDLLDPWQLDSGERLVTGGSAKVSIRVLD